MEGERGLADAVDDNKTGGVARPAPATPAVDLNCKEKNLKARIGIEFFPRENPAVKNDHRKSERVIPDAAADEEADIDEAGQDRRNLDRALAKCLLDEVRSVVHARPKTTTLATGVGLDHDSQNPSR